MLNAGLTKAQFQQEAIKKTKRKENRVVFVLGTVTQNPGPATLAHRQRICMLFVGFFYLHVILSQIRQQRSTTQIASNRPGPALKCCRAKWHHLLFIIMRLHRALRRCFLDLGGDTTYLQWCIMHTNITASTNKCAHTHTHIWGACL